MRFSSRTWNQEEIRYAMFTDLHHLLCVEETLPNSTFPAGYSCYPMKWHVLQVNNTQRNPQIIRDNTNLPGIPRELNDQIQAIIRPLPIPSLSVPSSSSSSPQATLYTSQFNNPLFSDLLLTVTVNSTEAEAEDHLEENIIKGDSSSQQLCSSKSFLVHKMILYHSSEYFKTLFLSEMKESHQSEIFLTMEDLSEITLFEEFLKCLYCLDSRVMMDYLLNKKKGEIFNQEIEKENNKDQAEVIYFNFLMGLYELADRFQVANITFFMKGMILRELLAYSCYLCSEKNCLSMKAFVERFEELQVLKELITCHEERLSSFIWD